MKDNEYFMYDFDGTIYDGDSSIDFWIYNILKKPVLMIYTYKFFVKSILYFLHLVEKEELKQAFFYPIIKNKNLDKILNDFWNKNDSKIKKFFKNEKGNKIIISASPEFLIKPIAKKYKCYLIATKFNLETGEIIGKNCLGEEKVYRLKSYFRNKRFEILKFYSDSDKDMPLTRISQKSFKVKNETIKEWKVIKEK